MVDEFSGVPGAYGEHEDMQAGVTLTRTDGTLVTIPPAVPSAATAYAAASSDFRRQFAEGLGINSWSWAWSNELSLLQLDRMTPEAATEAVRGYIKDNVSPNQLLDAIAGADPQNADLQTLIQTVKGNEAMATAFHKAIVEDPTMLERLPTLLNANGESDFSIADLNTALTHPVFGRAAQQQFTNALNLVADTDATFDHLLEIGNRGRQLANFDFNDFLSMARDNPDELIRNLLAGSGMENTALGQFLAGMLQGLMPMLVGILDTQNGLFAPWIQQGQEIYMATRANGAQIFQANAQRDGSVPRTGDEFDSARRPEERDVAVVTRDGPSVAPMPT